MEDDREGRRGEARGEGRREERREVGSRGEKNRAERRGGTGNRKDEQDQEAWSNYSTHQRLLCCIKVFIRALS